MRNWKSLIALIIVIMAIAFGDTGYRMVLAQQDPTIPTRTPTPDPNQPPPGPTATTEDPGNPPEGPANTPDSGSPGASPTATTQAPGTGSVGGTTTPVAGTSTGPTSPPVPLGGTIRANSGQSGSCSDTPYVEAIRRVIVYAGPGIDFGPVATLEEDEMRPIVGRAGFATWWQILVDNKTVGWVADTEVNEYGDTALVPVVAPPAINGNTPTPGAQWNPTPLPLLTCVPTPTATATTTGTPASEPSGIESAANEINEETAGSLDVTATPEMVSAIVESAPNSGAGDSVTQPDEEITIGSGVSSRGSEASRAASPTSMMNLVLPLAGLALIGGGIILALMSRTRGQAKSDKPE